MSYNPHTAIAVLSLIVFLIGGRYRIQSQSTGERLDRTKEGWPILISLRLLGLSALVVAILSFRHSGLSLPLGVRWAGVVLFALAVAWLIWMFRTLGRNITDTVVVRREAYFVDHGPYRFIRNPMYTGVLVLGIAFGLAMETWIVLLLTLVVFTLFVLRTRIEERYLIERFGDRYTNYMERVGRFFPRF